MKEEKRKGGRPPRAPGERMTRLSVVLRPRYRQALEIIARDRRTSLSQALEYLVAVGARHYMIDGKSVMSIVAGPEKGKVPSLEFFTWPDYPVSKEAQAKAEEEWAKMEDLVLGPLRETKAFKIRGLPPSLRNPEEQYFLDVLDGVKFLLAADSQALDSLYDVCLEAYQSGLSVEETINAIREAAPPDLRKSLDV